LTAAERNIPAPLKVEIFRIVQDALGNVARHSQADSVRVLLVEEDGELRLGIEDNGSGFDPALAARAGGARVGLPSIRKRVEATGGRMVLETGPQRGTRIGATWPIEGASASSRGLNADSWEQIDSRSRLRARS
jgi:signal transduction histidine kinase